MHDEPTSQELVAAVRDFIQNVAMKQLEGRANFHARVAANALSIVQRELELGPEGNDNERERLKTLLNQDGTLFQLNRELCARIRAGAIGLDTPGLTDHLWKTTLSKVAIDQPKYSAYKKVRMDRQNAFVEKHKK